MNEDILNAANSRTNNQAVKGGQEGYQGIAESDGSIGWGQALINQRLHTIQDTLPL